MRTYTSPSTGHTLTLSMLAVTLEDCNTSIDGNLVEITFADGCPTHLSSEQTLHPNAVACLQQRLGGVRWKCATALPCASYAWVTI
jgi:hypothetical protein